MNTLESIQDFKGTYPKHLWSLFFTEMWERFCFYGMRGMLVVFMVSHLGMDETVANLQSWSRWKVQERQTLAELDLD